MARHLFLVSTNAVEGHDDEFNEWYDGIHLREVLGLPEFVGAQRFELSAALPGSPAPSQRYLTIYEIETDDVDGALQRLRDSVGTMTMTPAIDRSSVAAFTVQAIGERVTKETVHD
jgi:hypothetical protein